MNITKETALKIIDLVREGDKFMVEKQIQGEIEQILVDYSNKCLDIVKHF